MACIITYYVLSYHLMLVDSRSVFESIGIVEGLETSLMENQLLVFGIISLE